MVFHVKNHKNAAMLNIADLTGLWTRSLQAWPDGRRDTTTNVGWLQGITVYADLRQPPAIAGQFIHARCLSDLTLADCKKLAMQQGFSGVFVAGTESFEWVREIDYQPRRKTRDIGRLFWQGDILVEEGMQGDYIEHWHRDPVQPLLPCAALTLKGKDDHCQGSLLRTGNNFMYSRARQVAAMGDSLSDAIEGATDLHAAQALIDFEISAGIISDGTWWITRSTLPFRADSVFTHGMSGSTLLGVADLDPNGAAMTRHWEITASEGNLSAFFDGDSEDF
jgi:hypothetical protein